MEDVDFAHPLNVSSYHKSMLLVGVCGALLAGAVAAVAA